MSDQIGSGASFEGERGDRVEATAAFEHYHRVIDEKGIRCFRCAD